MRRYIFLFVGAFLLSGCSPESNFLQSMNGRWSQDGKAFNLYSVDDKLVMLDDAGSLLLMTPSGKFDSANKLIPVSFVNYENYSNDDLLSKMRFSLVVGEVCSHSEKANNCRSQSEIKKILHNGMQGNLILFNASASPDKEVGFGARQDDGGVVFNSTFVRQLTVEEQKDISNYSEKLAVRNAFIDKEVEKEVARKLAKEAKNKADAEEAEKQAKIEEQMAQERSGSYYMVVAEYYEGDADSGRKVEWRQGKMKELGFDTYTKKIDNKIYVCIGPYKERAQAEEASQMLERQGFSKSETRILREH